MGHGADLDLTRDHVRATGGSLSGEPAVGRRFVVACAVGAALGFAVVALIVSLTGVGPTTRHFSDDFFDAQARAWLDGRWDVPADVVGVEGYATDGGMQMYFGVAPALARLPILAVTTSLDGKLSLPSQLLALALLAVATARILATARTRLARAEHPTRTDDLVAGAFLFLVTGASTATFLAAQPTVYTEAVLWAVALAVASMDLLLRHRLHPSTGRAVGAAVCAVLALNARITVGAGALLPVLVVGVRALLEARRRSDRSPTAGPLRTTVTMLAIAAVGVGVFLGANIIRFGAPLSIPYASQVPYRSDPGRLAELERTGGLFSPKYAPGNLVTYGRPDGLQLQPVPNVTFLESGEVARWLSAPPNLLEPTGSVPASMPALSILAGVGAIAVVRGRDVARLRVLRLSIAGSLVGVGLILCFGSIAHRYTGEFLPLLVVLGGVGSHRAAGVRSRPGRVAVGVALVAGALWGAWIQVGLSMTIASRSSLHNRVAVERWAATVTDLARTFGSGALDQPDAPPAARDWWNRIAAPDCSRVYLAWGGSWYGFERAPGTGAFRLQVSPPPDDGRPHPIVEVDDGRTLVALQRAGEQTTLVHSADGGDTWQTTSSRHGARAEGPKAPQALTVGEDGHIELTVDADPWTGIVSASGETPDTFLLLRTRPEGGVGEARLAPDYPGAVTELTEPAPRCGTWTTP